MGEDEGGMEIGKNAKFFRRRDEVRCRIWSGITKTQKHNHNKKIDTEILSLEVYLNLLYYKHISEY